MNLKNNVQINDNANNIEINTDEINYNLNKNQIQSSSNSEIKDDLGNIYRVSQFEYNLEDRIIKLSNLEVLDVNKNIFKIELAFLDLEKRELIAKDVGLNFKISDNSENEPRLKGRSLISNDENTIVKKGLLHSEKKKKKPLGK